MLVLTRKREQTICIYPQDQLGKDDHLIEICFLGMNKNQAKFGIKASDRMAVHRKEIYEKILREEALQSK